MTAPAPFDLRKAFSDKLRAMTPEDREEWLRDMAHDDEDER